MMLKLKTSKDIFSMLWEFYIKKNLILTIIYDTHSIKNILTFMHNCGIMYLSRKLAYNKKGNIQFLHAECLPNRYWIRHLILKLELDVFLYYINLINCNMIKSNKMIVTKFRTFKIKVFIFIYYQTSQTSNLKLLALSFVFSTCTN